LLLETNGKRPTGWGKHNLSLRKSAHSGSSFVSRPSRYGAQTGRWMQTLIHRTYVAAPEKLENNAAH